VRVWLRKGVELVYVREEVREGGREGVKVEEEGDGEGDGVVKVKEVSEVEGMTIEVEEVMVKVRMGEEEEIGVKEEKMR
jgi:hypothetical protein